MSYTSNSFIDMVEILFSPEKVGPKMCLKVNWSVKTPWHRPSMGVARGTADALIAVWPHIVGLMIPLIAITSKKNKKNKETDFGTPTKSDFVLDWLVMKSSPKYQSQKQLYWCLAPVLCHVFVHNSLMNKLLIRRFICQKDQSKCYWTLCTFKLY